MWLLWCFCVEAIEPFCLGQTCRTYKCAAPDLPSAMSDASLSSVLWLLESKQTFCHFSKIQHLGIAVPPTCLPLLNISSRIPSAICCLRRRPCSSSRATPTPAALATPTTTASYSRQGTPATLPSCELTAAVHADIGPAALRPGLYATPPAEFYSLVARSGGSSGTGGVPSPVVPSPAPPPGFASFSLPSQSTDGCGAPSHALDFPTNSSSDRGCCCPVNHDTPGRARISAGGAEISVALLHIGAQQQQAQQPPGVHADTGACARVQAGIWLSWQAAAFGEQAGHSNSRHHWCLKNASSSTRLNSVVATPSQPRCLAGRGIACTEAATAISVAVVSMPAVVILLVVATNSTH